jgi:hypothetical protein
VGENTSFGAAAGSESGDSDAVREQRRRTQAQARAARAAARTMARAIPPQRSADLAHLSLDGLRTYRSALAAEEDRVSYWRRILQARLDTVRAVEGARSAEPAAVAPALTKEKLSRGRAALVQVVPVDDIPPLPDLARLWQTVPAAGDEVARAELVIGLETAEEQLSTYRGALHVRISAANAELIARYRDEPQACFSALPRASSALR